MGSGIKRAVAVLFAGLPVASAGGPAGLTGQLGALMETPLMQNIFDNVGGRLMAAATGIPGARLRPLQRAAVLAGCRGRLGCGCKLGIRY